MYLRNMRCVFSLLCVLHAASASFAPNVHARVRPTAVRSNALRMAEKVKEPPPTIVPAAVAGETNVLAEVPFPSLYAIAYTAIVGLTLKDLAANVAIVSWIANGAALSDFPYTSFSGGVVLIAYMSYQLARMAGVGKVDHYSEGLESEGAAVNSLASQAAAWALAGEVPLRSADGKYEVATFAGGCFWGTELHFQRLPGVIQTCVGYTQGRTERPSYAEVSSGLTGHTEALMLTYDPKMVSYEALCEKLLSTVDSTRLNMATTPDGANDVGTQYRTGLYPHNEVQRAAALLSIEKEQQRQMRYRRKVVTEVRPAKVFWPAEKIHQRKLQKGGQSSAKNAAESIRCHG